MVDTKKLLVDYVRAFNAADEENVIQAIPNAGAEAWLMANAPRITIPDKDIERTYYFRLWTYRKHLKKRINEVLWDEEKRFYINVPQDEMDGEVSRLPVRRVRELYGYMPWAYGAEEKGRTDAFRQLFDPEGFFGKRGITTTERRSEGYGIFYTGEELNQWRRIRLIAGMEEGCRAE